MRKIILGLYLGLLLLCFVFSADKKRQVNSWEELFTEPIETIYIFMKDGATFLHSSQDEAIINMRIGLLEKKLKEKNSSIKEIAIVIHNHRRKNYFSHSDYKQYRMLKKYGFDGQFLMYCHRTEKVYDIEEKKGK